MPIPSHLLPHRVRIEVHAATGTDASGGTTTGATVVADKVPCLISQGSGRPDQRFEQQQGTTRYTVSGNLAAIARTDVVFVVLKGPAAGRTLKVVGVSGHGPSPGVIGSFYRATAEEPTVAR